MPDVKLKLGNDTLNINPAGDLVKNFKTDAAGLIQLADRLVPEVTGTLQNLPDTVLSTSFTLDKEGKWAVDGIDLSLSVQPTASGTLTFVKTGELFHYFLADDPKNSIAIQVPEGRVYVVITLNAGLTVTGAGQFSSGDFGVTANVSSATTFALVNYKSFDATTLASTAIVEAFGGFALPFTAASVDRLNDGDYLDFSFVGKLKLGFGATWGLSGVLLGGRSGAEIAASLDRSPIGKLAFKAKPTFKADAEFSVKYDHNSTFRVIAGRTNSGGKNAASLYLFRLKKDDVTVGLRAQLTLSGNATFDASTGIDSIIDKATKSALAKLPTELPAAVKDAIGTQISDKVKAGEGKLDGFVKDTNTKINALLKNADGQKIVFEETHENVTTDTALFQYHFDLSVNGSLDGLSSALKGDYRTALAMPGVDLEPGAFVEHQFTSRATVGFQFFGLASWTGVSEYFSNRKATYAGNGIFHIVAQVGDKIQSSHAGGTASCEVYFSASANDKVADETIEGLDVSLVFETVDTRSAAAGHRLGKALNMVANAGDDLEEAALAIQGANLTQRTVKATCTFPPATFSALRFDPAGTTPQLEDKRNYEMFVGASTFLLLPTPVPRLFYDTYEHWAEFNVVAVSGIDGSGNQPNRRELGGQQLPGEFIVLRPEEQSRLRLFLIAAQSFMNLCEDLPHLRGLIDVSRIEQDVANVIKSLKQIIQKDVPEDFLHATMVALIQCMKASPKKVEFTGVDVDPVSVSFEVAA